MADLDRDYLNGIISRNNIDNINGHIFMPGYIPNSDLPYIYNAALAFLYTSLRECFGIPLLEAMACGIPVISFDCPFGPREIIDDGVTGYLVPPGDEKTLVERICFLIEHPDIRKRMSQSALKKAAQYSIERIMGEWVDLFNRLSVNKKR
jgi:glycosyltransferase involved in cell wall biosynthesis